MNNKHTSSYRFFWILLSIITTLTLTIIFVPTMINLNFLKPKIENIILNQTGTVAQIHGNVNFSLLGKAQIVAHNISIPNGVISSAEFAIPFFDIFNLKNANISGDISITGASLFVKKIVPFNVNTNMVIRNSKFKFLNKEYIIINATLSNDNIDALVRTDQHKYEIKSVNNSFIIKNKNNDLVLTGKLLSNGAAVGNLKITAQNINRWFEFENPRINGRFPISADFSWDGEYGVNFYNISADGVTGDIEFRNDGHKIVKLKSENADFNLSFLLNTPELLKNTSFDLDFYGKLKFMNKVFHHVKIKTIGSENGVEINTITLDDIKIHGGTIDQDGAHDVYIAGPLSGLHTTCLFNGTITDWYCKEYSHGNNITSVFSVKDDVINADVYSTSIYEDMKPFVVTIRKLASSGEVRFYYPDMDGTLHLKKDSYTVDYTRMEDKSLNQAKINLKFLPDFMKDEPGDFVWINGVMIFTPNSKQWQLSKSTDFFILHGEDFKQLTKKVDLQAFKDLAYVLSGNYKNGNISDFTVEIANHKFTGMLSGKSITLKTDVLNADLFINPSFLENFEELSFFTNHPLLLPFNAKFNIALSANKLIYDNREYNNFIYSLKNNSQTFSISDLNKGSLLASIIKNNSKYDINFQLNKFVFNGQLLSSTMPLNLSDTTITAEIKLHTYGIIAHDIIDNMYGDFDISFVGGKLDGLGFDTFYANAFDITTLNAEQRLTYTLQSGTTNIKKMHAIGTYKNKKIQTTQPFTLSAKHVDASGTFEIEPNKMFATLTFVLQGTSTNPEPIDLTIYPDGKREYSLSEIMVHFDPDYMRAYIQIHNQI